MTTSENTLARWITLGTCGGPFQEAAAHQISNALVVGDAVYLFDVGNGVLRQLAKAGLELASVRAVFTTHHHLDHIADLGLVAMTRWMRRAERPLEIRGPGGTERLVSDLCSAYALTARSFGDRGDGLARSLRVQEAPRGGGGLSEVYADDLLLVECIDVEHFHTPWASDRVGGEAEHAIGYRITIGGRIVAYTGDTGPCPALQALAEGADLLVSEVVDPDAMLARLAARPGGASEEELGSVGFVMRNCHLEAREIAFLAQEAGVGEVVLTHYVPHPRAGEAELLVERMLAVEPGLRVRAASDLDEFEVVVP